MGPGGWGQVPLGCANRVVLYTALFVVVHQSVKYRSNFNHEFQF
jgi:hypothetical protein